MVPMTYRGKQAQVEQRGVKSGEVLRGRLGVGESDSRRLSRKTSVFYTVFGQPVPALQSLLFTAGFALINMHFALAAFQPA